MCIAIPIVSTGQNLDPAQVVKASDRLHPSSPGSLKIEGFIGKKMNECIANRVMAQDIDKIVEPFRLREEKDFNGWRCEYWGKWFTSAALGCSYDMSDNNKSKIDNAVSALLKTQTADGYIGTYKSDVELNGWDVWGRKYVLLGLIAYYDLTKDKRSLEAASKELDHLITQVGPGKINIANNGLDAINGLSSSSILEPVSLMYQRTGNQKYKAFAEYIVGQWSKPNKFTSKGIRLVEDALGGVDPVNIAAPKAYEMMSCYEGLCELYRIAGDKKYLDAAVAFANRLIKKEITITGSGSEQELWFDGARQQTQIIQQPMETCVTVTWMKLCYQLLRLTGDPKWADQLEVSLYNALAGAMTPGGNWWSYFSPLTGERVPSTFQHNDVGLSCCVANGPRGLLLTPAWAGMTNDKGLVINLFAKGSYEQQVNHNLVKLIQETDYPVSNKVVIHVNPSKPAVFTLSLRIPAWSKRTVITINGQKILPVAGEYAKIERQWKQDDVVTVEFDFRGRLIPAPSGSPDIAIMRGPIVLALDNRLIPPQDTVVSLFSKLKYGQTVIAPPGYQYLLPQPVVNPYETQQYIEMNPVVSENKDIWMTFEVAFVVRPSHFFNHHEKKIILCDYASAGNQFSADNVFSVWMPQPLFLKYAYLTDTWKLMYPGMKNRPTIPAN